MRVLSLFDGMSCGQIALKKAGFQVTSYVASEIATHAIKCTGRNFPETIQAGDVTNLTGDRVRELAGGEIDLVLAGSPCQNLSGLNTVSLNGLEGKKSRLFFEFFRLLEELDYPDFLLENVKPKKPEWATTTNEKLGVESVMINSADLMPYSRPRCYWASFDIEQPQAVNTSFADFIDFTSTENTLADNWHEWWERNKEFQLKKQYSRIVHPDDKGVCMTARQYASWNGNFIPTPAGKLRKPTKKELALLVGAPVNYFDCVTQRQAEEMTGNGWTIPVITHIFNCYKQSKFAGRKAA